MGRLRQLPALYLRGGLANQTMANLNKSQINEVSIIFDKIKNSQCLAPDKHEFIKQLGLTIGGDYKSDRSTAEHEFDIAIWRAVVHLLYHKEYKYICTLCDKDSYQIKSGKMKQFNRQNKICLNCKRSFYDGHIIYVNKVGKQYILKDIKTDKIIKTFYSLHDVENVLSSPIKAIGGESRSIDPYKIIEDEIQIKKWFSAWVWNYLRQILNENIIKTHNHKKIQIHGLPTFIATQLIIDELKRTKFRHYYFDEMTLHNSSETYNISINIDYTPINFTVFLNSLRYGYANYNVDIIINDCSITIKPICDVHDLPIIEDTIMTKENVVVLSTDSHDDESNDYIHQQISEVKDDGFRSIENIIHDDSTRTMMDKINLIFKNDSIHINGHDLNRDDMIMIIELYMQNGKSWDTYHSMCGDSTPSKYQLSKYLNLDIKIIDMHIEIIKTLLCDMELVNS